MNMPHASQKYKEKRSIPQLLFGDSQTHTLENRVFNVVSFLVGLMGILATFLNYFSGNPIREVLFSMLTVSAGFAFYTASLKLHKDRYLRTPMVAFFLAILISIWFTNQGSQGSTPLFFFILFVAGIIMLEPPFDLILLGISFLTAFALLLIEWNNPTVILPYLSDMHRFYDVSFSWFISLMIVTLLVRLVVREYQRERIQREVLYEQVLEEKTKLEQALAEIKILQGILPVCSFCKKIRDEDNEWHAMEHYISSHSQAEFSHGFCPTCAEKHYPDFFKANKVPS